MPSRTLEQLQVMIRRRLGWPVADTFVTDEEIFDMLKESRRELLDFLISVHQGDYRLGVAQFDTTASVPAYVISPGTTTSYGTTPAAQADFVRINKIALVVNDVAYPMKRWDIETSTDRDTAQAWDTTTDVRYRIIAGVAGQTAGGADGVSEKILYFTPPPNGAFTVRIWGTQGLENQTFSATDSVNTIGHDEYLVLDGMIKCLQMEETDASAVIERKERLIQRIANEATPLDEGQPSVIQDVRSRDGDGPIGWWR